MPDEAGIDQLLQIVGDVRAEIVAAGPELARRQLRIADIEEKQRLHAVHVGAAHAVELVLDHVEQSPMEPLHQRQRIEIERLGVVRSRSAAS